MQALVYNERDISAYQFLRERCDEYFSATTHGFLHDVRMAPDSAHLTATLPGKAFSPITICQASQDPRVTGTLTTVIVFTDHILNGTLVLLRNALRLQGRRSHICVSVQVFL